MNPGHWLIAVGIALIVIGALWLTGALSWFGRLPGDIRIERPGFALYLPIVSMLLASTVLSLLWRVLERFFRE